MRTDISVLYTATKTTPSWALATTKLDPNTQRYLRTFGDLLRQTREDHDVSQYVLAAAAGMTRTNYARIEGGNVNVTLDTMLRIANAIGVDLEIRFRARLPKTAAEKPKRSTKSPSSAGKPRRSSDSSTARRRTTTKPS